MAHRQFLCLGLLFGTILTPPLVAAKRRYYGDLTYTEECVGIPMHCGKEEDCYQGLGVDSGISHVINKGGMEATSCGRELSVYYLGVAYKFVILCYTENCNASPPGPTQAETNPNIVAAIMGLALLLCWLL